jgi:PAS domain S-box-containing protein
MTTAPTPDVPRQVLFTNKARCRDCYRCVRVCPVKAIRMHEGQANVVESRCIGCGTCVRECPQGAKSYRHDLDRAVRLIASGVPVAVSVAPSFAAAYPAWQRRRLPSALRRLGFAYVGETALGAYHVARQTAAIAAARPERSHICTACPAVVRYVERYRPELVEHLVPVVSPMLAHARHIRARMPGEVRVVFIGPCVAKKAEAERPEHAGLVDCVLTFAELDEWFRGEAIDLSACEESDFDETPEGDARLFPLKGGSVRTSGWSTDLLAGDVVAASGFDNIGTVLDGLLTEGAPRLVEPLFCSQGCINGPAMIGHRNSFLGRSDVLSYASAQQGRAPEDRSYPELTARFHGCSADVEQPVTEEQIRHVLEMTGKARDTDQLNCGACGYATCRDKAVAVIRGMAEPEMCMPHMKRLAEQRVDRIIETSPNGIVILDEHLHILHMNPAFRRFFMCSDAVYGQPISYLFDPEPFERLASGQEQLVERTIEYRQYNLVCHEILYPLREERQYVGILVNVTHSRSSQEKLAHLREQTVLQARELLEHQIQMAQRLAQFLGESTAKGEDLVEKLLLLTEEDSSRIAKRDQGNGGQWLRDTYTSK